MDYSSYRVKNLSTPSINKNPKRTRKTNKKPAFKKVSDLIVVAIVIVSFAITAVVANIIGGGELIATLSFFNSPDCYYLVTTAEPSAKYTALAESSYIINTGGAGNLYAYDDGYIVVISAYTDAESAETVSQKNNNTQVLRIELECPTTIDLTEYTSTLYSDINTYLVDLIEICIGIDNLDIIESVALSAIKDMRNTLLSHIAYLAEIECDSTTSNIINGILQPLYGGLDAILYDADYMYLSGAIRTVVVTELCALESL